MLEPSCDGAALLLSGLNNLGERGISHLSNQIMITTMGLQDEMKKAQAAKIVSEAAAEVSASAEKQAVERKKRLPKQRLQRR